MKGVFCLSCITLLLLVVYGQPQRSFTSVINLNDPSLAITDSDFCMGNASAKRIQTMIIGSNNNRDTVYIGATNNVLQMSSDLVFENKYVTGPIDDDENGACLSPPHCPPRTVKCAEAICTNSFNKILIAYRDRLIACGTTYGTCNLLFASNVSHEFMPEDNRIQCHSTNSIVSIRQQAPPIVATVFVNKGEADDDLLYVGNSGSSAVNAGIIAYLAPSSVNPFFTRVDKTENYITTENTVSTSIYAWSTSTHSFILSRYTGENDGILFHTKIVRLCHSSITPISRTLDENDRNFIEEARGRLSYTEIDIRCNVTGISYTKAIHAELVFETLFIMFEKDSEFVICTKVFNDVNDEINFARRECLEGKNRTDLVVFHSGDCKFVPNLTDINVTCAYDFEIRSFLSTIRVVKPVDMLPQFQYQRLNANENPTTFTIGRVNDIFSAFIGTSSGRLLKARLGEFPSTISETIILDQFNPILKSIALSSDGNSVYSITDNSVFKVGVASCETQYLTCDSCVSSRDPYCGWCVYQNRCTQKAICQGFESGQRWINSTRTSDQCPVISTIAPNVIAFRSTETIALTLQGSELLTGLPSPYQCEFLGNDNMVVSAPSNVNGVITSSPNCRFDSVSNSAVIPQGYDHVNVTLSLKYDGIRVASGTFQVFDCQLIREINKYSMCTSCTSSKWPCKWCLGSNTCTNSNCQSSSTEINNSSLCPLLTGIAYPTQPIPVGKNHAIQISTVRLPVNVAGFQDKDYTCWFNNCGSITTSRVVVNVSSGILSCTVLASQLTCDEASFELQVSVRMGEYVIDKMPGRSMTVTVFNCSAESLNCGRCVSFGATFSECAWCPSSSPPTCAPVSTCQSGSVSNIDQCPPPKINNIFPLSGPVEGGTALIIGGHNLGTQPSEIISVMIENINCVIQSEYYEPSTRIRCLTDPTETGELSGSVVVLTNYTNVTAVSSETFNFKDVLVTGFSPALVLNGSTIEITGQNLDVGSLATIVLTGNGINYTAMCLNREVASMRCRLPIVTQLSEYNVSVNIDSFSGVLSEITFVQVPSVSIETPISGFQSAGGRLTIQMSSLDGVQFANLQIGQGQLTSCNVDRATSSVTCALSPQTTSSRKRRQAAYNATTAPNDPSQTASLILNGVHRIPLGPVTYVPDPKISPQLNELQCNSVPASGESNSVPNNTQSTLSGPTDTIEIRGSNFDSTGADRSDFRVTLTPPGDVDSIACVVTYLDSNSLFCQASASLLSSSAGENLLLVVQLYNLTLERQVMYCSTEFPVQKVAIGVAIGILVVIIVLVFCFCFWHRRNKRKQAEENKMILSKLDDLENKTRETARNAYFELQAGYMTNLTDNISDRITYLLPSQYFTQTLFNERRDPVLDPLALQHISASQKTLYLDWIKLLKQKDFLLIFIGTLEEQRKFTVQEKGKVASLLTICLFSDLAYLTRVMLDLLSHLIEKHVAKNPKLLLRRSESVVEKLVSHWLSITLYEDCITEKAGKPLFLLTKAVHYLVSSAPCDIIANKAFNSLNEITLLSSEITYETMTLDASVMHKDTNEATPFTEIKVVNVDTITQAKTKIIEAVYKDRPYSECPKPDDLDFVLLPGEEDKKGIVLSDIDSVSESEGNYTKLNTIKFYNVPDKAKVILKPVNCLNEDDQNAGGFQQFLDRNYSFSVNAVIDCNRMSQDSKLPLLSSRKMYHLIHAEDETNTSCNGNEEGNANALLDNIIKRPFQEIYLTRMVRSKTTLQEYVDDVFKSILCPKPIPRAVRYFFQFLDREAAKHKINDSEVIHIWKTNSLLLRYWVNVLKNPEFLFDTNKTAIVDSCLNVITQAFMDACTTTSRKLGQDSPSNKLLYAKDADRYKKMVKEFFVDISNTPEIPKNGIDDMLQQQSKEYSSKFNELVAAQQLYDYLEKYREEVIEALKNDNQHTLANSVQKLSLGSNAYGNETTVV